MLRRVNCSEIFQPQGSSSVTKQFSLVNNVSILFNTSHPRGSDGMDVNDSEGSAMTVTRLDSLYL